MAGSLKGLVTLYLQPGSWESRKSTKSSDIHRREYECPQWGSGKGCLKSQMVRTRTDE